MPRSIFDSIPADNPVSLESSTTVMSSFFRKARTSLPMANSRLLWPAPEPVRSLQMIFLE